ncbi:MAG: hypothetical protein IJ322_04665 [Clostridia bacterium]|nr:hypothetical protein [Clostridia bacterium]
MHKTKQSNAMLGSCILFLLFAIMLIYIFFIALQDLNNSKTKYEDLIYKEFTIEHISKQYDPEMGYKYTITILEDDKNIFVNNLLTKRDIRVGLDSLKEGDKIYCYLIETTSRYECVELKSDIMILSLDQYNQIYYKEGILGLIITPIAFLICFVFSIKFFHTYHSEKKANKENKDI